VAAVRARHLVGPLSLGIALSGCGGETPAPAVVGPGAAPAQSQAPLDTEPRRQGYAVGYQIGEQLRDEGPGLDPAAAADGLRDGLSGAASRLSSAERDRAFQSLESAQLQETAGEAERNLSEGTAFLAANRNNPEVVELPSGLQYRVVEAGEGRTPGPNDTVRVHYRGTLIDGTEFDSSHARGEPEVLAVGQVIEGWQQALQRMQEGARWQVFVPPDLAYGLRGAGDVIGPNATLIFDVELIGIE
jgi:FKBP-type peptidyl-prolyl cis-trans isomerase FklB